jgi:hypothetical protein
MTSVFVSIPGWIGAGIGLLLALIVYVAMANAWKQQLAGASGADERAKAERGWSIVRLILLSDFVILAAFGYYAGQFLGS